MVHQSVEPIKLFQLSFAINVDLSNFKNQLLRYFGEPAIKPLDLEPATWVFC